MFNTENILEIDSEIKKIEVLNNSTVVYSDSANGIKILDVNSSRQMFNLKIKNKSKSEIPFCFSPNKKRLVYVADKSIYVLDTLLKKDNDKFRTLNVINTINIDYEVTCLSFDPSSTYFFVGTQDNEVIQYRHNSTKEITKLTLFEKFKKRTKGISAFSFLESTLLVSGNRGDLVKVDIFSNISQKILINESTSINNLLYLDGKHVLSGHSNGDLRIVDITKMNVYTNVDTIFTSINQSIHLTNERYALVCGDSNSISLIDLKDKKTAMARYITFDEHVRHMALISENVLIVLLTDNRLVKVNLPTTSQLASLIIHNSLDEAYELIKKDILLVESQEYINLESQYKSLVTRAISEITEQNKDFAKQTLSLFDGVACKKDEISNILKAFDNYKKFQNMFFEKDYALAYNLVYRYPALKQTPEYIRMEYLFRQTLEKAQVALIKGRWEEADSLLRTYKSATYKKAIIKLFLNHGSNFLKYMDIIKNKDMDKLKEASQTDEVFAQYLIYFGVELDDNTVDTTLIDKCLKDGKVDRAEEILAEYKEDDIKIDYKTYYTKCKLTKDFYSFHEDNDFKNCYELIDKYDFLLENKLGKSFTKYWKNLILHTEISALNGELDKVEKSLSKLEGLLLRETKVKNLIKLSYQIKIDMRIESDELDLAHELIDKYIIKFSRDTYIDNKMKLFDADVEPKPPNIFDKINLLVNK